LAAFLIKEKSSSLPVWALPNMPSTPTLGRGEGVGRCYQQTPARRHLVFSPHLQTDDIFSHVSKFFLFLAHLNS
jgi:hypothetical protein